MAHYDDAGELNRKVTFQRFIGEGDIVGDDQYLDDSNWEDVITVWAQVKTISSREFMTAGQEQDEVIGHTQVRHGNGLLLCDVFDDVSGSNVAVIVTDSG